MLRAQTKAEVGETKRRRYIQQIVRKIKCRVEAEDKGPWVACGFVV